MDVFVDGAPAGDASAPTPTFREAFAGLRRAAGEKGRLVVSLALDGTELSAKREAELADQPPPTTGRLDVRTSETREVVRETLEGMLGQTAAIERLHGQAAEQIIAGKYKDAMGVLQDCFKGWALLLQPLRNIAQMLRLDWTTVSAGAETAEGLIARVAEALGRFKDAFAAQDVVRMGDVAQYELQPLIAGWKAMLEAVRSKAAAR